MITWSDEAVVLGARPHGETAAIADVFSRNHGRVAGLVHGGRSRKTRPALQTGSMVAATWQARVAEQLGTLRIELTRSPAAEAMADTLNGGRRLACLTCVATLLRLLPERDPHPAMYEVTQFLLGFLDVPEVWPALYIRWELALLEDMGFGLDLKSCAATGRTGDLVWVSPKSGRAVSGEAGAPYRDKLLPLPEFMLPGRRPRDVSASDLAAGLALTGHFLLSRVLLPRGDDLPEARGRLLPG